jgi:hypothetical protein
MKLEDIQTQWELDCKIDRTELGEESLRIPQLHSKYFKIYSSERLTLKKLESDYKILYKQKHEYFNGNISEEELNENGWEPFQLKLLKSDIPLYMEADSDLIKIKQRIELQQEKLDFLDSVIKSLTNRGFQIKNAIDWMKFTQGA